MEIRYNHPTETDDLLADLAPYREKIQSLVDVANPEHPESALATWHDDLLHDTVTTVVHKLGQPKCVILVGIGGSNLGTEAVFEALKQPDSPLLLTLDVVSDTTMVSVLMAIEAYDLDDIAICVISKSGGTVETLSNAAVLLESLTKFYGDALYARVVCIGNEGNSLLTTGAALGCHTISMPEIIGGRYSVFTAVGLVPLLLLRINIEALLFGVKEALTEHREFQAAQGAAVLKQQLDAGVRIVNTFVFDVRLATFADWYRQLAAESLGKQNTLSGEPLTLGFLPVKSTPAELHSIAQLYFSGFKGIYTDFISVKDQTTLFDISVHTPLAPDLAGMSLQQVSSAIESGVIAAYDIEAMPYRKSHLTRIKEEEIGLLMGMRMLEVMYLANLLNVNAFDQPNVELYKQKTRDILHG